MHTPRSPRRMALALTLTLAMSLGLTACGHGSDEASSSPSATALPGLTAPSGSPSGRPGPDAVASPPSTATPAPGLVATPAPGAGGRSLTVGPADADAPAVSSPYAPDASGIGAQQVPQDPAPAGGGAQPPAVDGGAQPPADGGGGREGDQRVPAVIADAKGSTDLAAVIETAAKRGAGVELAAGARYTLSKPLVLPDSVPYLNGNGATLDVSIGGATASKPAAAISVASGASDTVVTNLSLNLAGSPYTRGVLADGASRLTLSRLTMVGVGHRGIEISSASGPVSDILIYDNTIKVAAGGEGGKDETYAVSLSAPIAQPDSRFEKSKSPAWDRYTTDGTIAPTGNELRNVSVVGNSIDGGHYGIGLSAVTSSVIKGNVSTNNTRSISMQNNASGNTVEANYLAEPLSSSVHIAYGSDNNTVRNNTIVSTRAALQGLMQAYQESDHNTFTGNSVTVSGQHPGWILYIGPGASGTTFSGNTVSGSARKAFIGIESVWDLKSARTGLGGSNDRSYMSTAIPSPADGSPTTFNGGWGDLTGVTVENNILHADNASVPLVYVGAEVSAGRDGKQHIVGNVTDLAVRGNTVVGKGYSEPIATHEGDLGGVGRAAITFADRSVGSFQDSGTATVDGRTYSTGNADNQSAAILLGASNLTASGTGGPDTLTGNVGANTLTGGAGDDVLDGAAGANTLRGGDGADTFVISGILDGAVNDLVDVDPAKDSIALSTSVFGRLDGAWFAQAGQETTGTRVTQKGRTLLYDGDGTGAALQPVAFATLPEGVQLAQANFSLR